MVFRLKLHDLLVGQWVFSRHYYGRHIFGNTSLLLQNLHAFFIPQHPNPQKRYANLVWSFLHAVCCVVLTYKTFIRSGSPSDVNKRIVLLNMKSVGDQMCSHFCIRSNIHPGSQLKSYKVCMLDINYFQDSIGTEPFFGTN